jgi:hypothetical protein
VAHWASSLSAFLSKLAHPLSKQQASKRAFRMVKPALAAGSALPERPKRWWRTQLGDQCEAPSRDVPYCGWGDADHRVSEAILTSSSGETKAPTAGRYKTAVAWLSCAAGLRVAKGSRWPSAGRHRSKELYYGTHLPGASAALVCCGTIDVPRAEGPSARRKGRGDAAQIKTDPSVSRWLATGGAATRRGTCSVGNSAFP